MNKLNLIVPIFAIALLSACATKLELADGTELTGYRDLYFLNAGLSQAPLGSAEEYLLALEDNETLMLEFDNSRRDDLEYSSLFSYQNSYYKIRRFKLIGDLFKAYPDTPELEELMLSRFELNTIVWQYDIREEVEEYVKTVTDTEINKEQAWFWYQSGIIQRNYNKETPIRSALAEFETLYPKSDYLRKLYEKAVSYMNGHENQKSLIAEFNEKFPNAEEAKRLEQQAERKAKLMANVGKEFSLVFRDTLSGDTIKTENFKGTILVIDFWATWCGPCVAEIPNMVNLYEKYKDQGVEFIGISLDSETATLRNFCKENNVTWPQYCEPNKTWDTSISQKWNINAVPTLFVVDQQGLVYSVEARGRVEELIRELQSM